MTDFCQIAPSAHLDDFCRDRPAHLLLAHLVEEDEQYRDWYKQEKTLNPETVFILDNSAFEQYRRGLPMFPSDKLLDLAKEVKADYVVMSDYPGQPSEVTIESAQKLASTFKNAGFGTFYCPQSKVGDLNDLVRGFKWGMESPEVDYIGVSILAVPNAYGVEKDNKLQRFLSRWWFLSRSDIREMFRKNYMQGSKRKRIHLLGMVDGPNEILLLGDILQHVDTWDSSAAVWAGLNGIKFDTSPTGLVNGKFELEVDFASKFTDSTLINLAHRNIEYIDMMLDYVHIDWVTSA